MDEPRRNESGDEAPVDDQVDIDALTAAVERLLRRELEIERERLGRGPSPSRRT